MQKILVIGGHGFIGRHLVFKLNKMGHDVRVFSRHARREHHIQNGVEYIAGDFLCLDELKPALADVHTVYHLAVTTIPGSSNRKIIYDAQTNLMGTLQLLQAAATVGVQRFIFVSSGGSVYGPSPKKPISEAYPTNPISAHGVSKLAIEKYLEIYRRTYGIEYRVARAGNPYGEGQNPDKGQGFIARVLAQLARKEEIVIWGDGNVVRDFFYVGDLAEALVLMLDDEAPYRVYNVGSGEGKSLLEMIRILESITGKVANLRFEPGRTADVPYNWLDIARIREALAWEPETNLPSGVERTWKWLLSYLYC